jgi:hypothetical protein
MESDMGSDEKRALNFEPGKPGGHQPAGNRSVESNDMQVQGLPLEHRRDPVQRVAADLATQSEGLVRNVVSQAVLDRIEQPGKPPEAGVPSPEQIAERVYELFRRDLRVYLERKGY